MKLGFLPVAILIGFVTLVLAAGHGPAPAEARVATLISITPERGPCDGPIRVDLRGFDPGAEVSIDVALPQSDQIVGTIAMLDAGADGTAAGDAVLGGLGCFAAASDFSIGGAGLIFIYADALPDSLDINGRAEYAYTTTEAAGASSPVAPATAAPSSGAPTLPGTGIGGDAGDSSDIGLWIAIGGVAALVVTGAGALLLGRRSRV